MRLSILTAVSSALLCAGAVRGQIDPKNFDSAVKPQTDFYRFANGGWFKTNTVPADKTSWGPFDELEERNRANLHAILERAAAARNPGSAEKLVGDFYASGMDEAAIEAAGITPVRAALERMAALKSPADVQAELVRLHRRGIRPGFFFSSEPDPKNSAMVIAGLGQGGLGLPDRDYYFRDDDKSQQLREHYVAHIARLFVLAGDAADAARAAATAVMQLETALAQGSKTNVDIRDPVANYHRMAEAELQKLTPHFDWRAYFTALDLSQPGDLDVGQPEFFAAFDRQLEATPVTAWRDYLRWNLLHGSAPYLSRAFVEENFAFYGRTLTGQEKMRDRWKRVLQRVDGSVGEALGQLYVAAHFPPEAKARMLELVGHLQGALRERLQKLEWMDEPTRAKALEKLNALTVKIGYPDTWRDYSPLVIDRGAYVLNVQRAEEFEVRRDLAKVGHPVDKSEWGFSPPTVNAYYNPPLNEIVFPAGILQSPFFSPTAGDAANYGSIGSIIGHEITHGFDDSGRQFDAVGNLVDWWSPASAARFKERAAGIVTQFNGYPVLDDLHVNGELTQGENLADLGGLKIAFAALQRVLREKPVPEKVDGFTVAQRFFLSYATAWRTVFRPETQRMLVQTDPHAPTEWRVNGPLSNLEEFAHAFDVPEGAPMRRAAAERVEIW